MAVTPQEQLQKIKETTLGIQSQIKAGVTPTPSPETSSFDLAAVLAKLQESTGVVSSEPTALDKAIEGITTRLEKAGEERKAGITAGAERLAGEIKEVGARKLTTALESQRGFAMNQQVLRQIETETEKSLKDLELRKQEAIGSGALELAEKISNLQLKSIEFREESRQKTFSNLLNLASVGLRLQEEQRAVRQQSFAEQQAISKVALDFGVEVKEGDTIETITTRAQPFASEKQKLELEKQKADIARANAEAAKALRGEDFIGDEVTMDIISKTLSNLSPTSAEYGTLISSLDKKPDVLAKVLQKVTDLNKPRDFSDTELEIEATKAFNAGLPLAEVLTSFATNPKINNKARAEEILRKKYNKPVEKGGGIFSKITEGIKTELLGSPERRRLNELDKKFREGNLSEEDQQEYFNLIRKAGGAKKAFR